MVRIEWTDQCRFHVNLTDEQYAEIMAEIAETGETLISWLECNMDRVWNQLDEKNQFGPDSLNVYIDLGMEMMRMEENCDE